MSENVETIRILVVDDDEVDRLAIKRALNGIRDFQFDVMEVTSAKEVMENAVNSRFDIIFLDYLLPDGDGLSVLIKLREQSLDTPVIILTGQGDERLAVELIHSGASDYLPKSTITAARLHESISNAISKFRAEKERQRSHDELQKKSTHIEGILESITDAFFTMDKNWRFIFINTQAESLLEINARDAISENVNEVLVDMDPWFREALQEGVSGNRQLSCEGYFNAVGKWLEIHIYPGQDGVSVYFQDISERKNHEKELSHLAKFDSLTDLPNRVLLHEKINQAMGSAKSNTQKMALLFCDLDGFKAVNDDFGHDAGDKLLQIIAKRLASTVRSQDTVARVGGDEFVVLLDGILREEDIRRVAGNLIRVIAQPVQIGTEHVHVTASIGISIFPDHGTDAEQLLKYADLAMYYAKNTGKNRLEVFNESLEANLTNKLVLGEELSSALSNGELEVYYQPQIDIKDNRVTGIEALLRWRHPTRGMLTPSAFLESAEESGLIVPIGLWAMETAVRDMAAWQKHGYRHMGVYLNISQRQFETGGFIDSALELFAKLGIETSYLTFELLEQVIIEQNQYVIETLHKIKKSGINICIDNFGRGYASVALLGTLPIDTVKIDKSFVQNMATNSRDAAMTKAIYTMGTSLDIKVIVGGIESVEQQKAVEAFDCRNVQGFLYCQPMPVAELLEFLDEFRESFGGKSGAR